MSTYLIKEKDGSFVERVPTEGKWYCGFKADESYADRSVGYIGPDGKHGWRDEEIAQFEHDAFYEKDYSGDWREVYFGGYDWIAEQ